VCRVLLTTSTKVMKNKLQHIVLIAIAILLVYAGWLLKPASHITDVQYVDVPMPVDSASIISNATEGLLSREEAIEKFGKTVTKTIWKYETHVDTSDTTIVDTVWLAIPFISARDSAKFSGFNVLDEDTVKYSLVARVATSAYFSPVNLIENNITISDIIISFEKDEITLLEAAKLVWWLLPTGMLIWEIVR